MSRGGFVKLRRGALDHVEAGRVGLLDLGVFALLLLRSNSVVGAGDLWPAGIAMSSAKAISAYAPRNIGEREIQRSLSNLERAKWIKRFRTPGRHGNYPVLLCRHSVHDLSGNEFRVDGENTTDWRHPKLVPVSELSPVADGDGTRAGTELSPTREKRTEKQEETTLVEKSPSLLAGERLANLLVIRVLENNPTAALSKESKRKRAVENWSREFDLMIREDGRPESEIRMLIDWCQQDEFWKANVLSAKTLRKKRDQLFMKMGAAKSQSQKGGRGGDEVGAYNVTSHQEFADSVE